METGTSPAPPAADTRTLRRRWYVLSAARESLPVFAVYALFMQARGASPAEISALLAIWSIAAFVFEVPSGVLADRFDRVWVMACSRVLQAAAFALWWYWPTFPGFALGFVLWGLAGAMWSGTNEAWLFEALHARAAGEQYERIYAAGSAWASVGICIALASGGLLASQGFGWTILASCCACIAVAILTRAWLPTVGRTTAAHGGPRLPPLRAALADYRASAGAREAASALALGFVFFACFEEYVGLVFDAGGVPLAELGFAYAACYAARAGAQASMGRFGMPAPKGDALAALLCSGVILGAGMLLATAGLGAIGLFVGLLGYFAASGVAEVRIVSMLQREQGGDGRATLMSLARLGLLATGPIVYAAIAALATPYGWLSSVWFSAVGTVLVAGLLMVLRGRRRSGRSAR